MSTENQIEANRRNAQLCTGPKTEEGKARSSQNALKTGIYSKAEVLITENREAYEQLIAAFYEQFAPATPQEACLLDALIRYEWLSRRYMAADTATWNCWLSHDKDKDSGVAFLRYSGELARAGRYFTTTRKGFTQTLKELKALQAERKAELTSEPSQSPALSRDREGAVTQSPALSEPQTNQPLAGKLVSFRQPEFAQSSDPGRTPEPDEQNDEAPPKAA
jgi:hypothetical protein